MNAESAQHQNVGDTRTGIASWYVPQVGLTGSCASNFLPMGTRVRVTFGDKSVEAVVVGTGPRSDLGRIIDLTPDLFLKLAPMTRGVITVQVTRLP